ncbi:MAG: hypothetical protein HC841_00670 [Verrucomicrobiae bacterium]|nr:hypothetical protein [Verrucomicrobiae bacterium]
METLTGFRHIPRMPKPTKAEMHAAIRRAHGILRRKPGDEPLAVWWARHKAEERKLEESRFARHSIQADRP